MENLPSEIQWNIIKFLRHPIADVFQDIVMAAYERDVYMEEWGINYELKRHPDNIRIQAKYNKRLEKLKAYSLYDLFKQDKYDLKFFDKVRYDKIKNQMDTCWGTHHGDMDGPEPYTREWYANPCEYDPALDPNNNR